MAGAASFLRFHLAQQSSWDSTAWPRLAIFALTYFLLALALPQRYSFPAVLLALVGWTIFRVGILPPFAAAYLLGSCYLLGRRVSKVSDVATQILIGMAGTIFTVWWAIHLPINYRWVYWVAVGLPYLTVRPLPRLSLPSRSVGTLACGFFLAAQWVMVLKPEKEKEAEEAAYRARIQAEAAEARSEEHTSELQSH